MNIVRNLLDRMPQYDRLISTVKALAVRTDEVSTLVNGVAYTGSPALPINPYKVRATITAAQAIASGVITVVKLDTVIDDPIGGFDTTNFRYTVGLAGWYVITAVVQFGMVAQANAVQTFNPSVYRNGASLGAWQTNFLQPAGGTASNQSAPIALGPLYLVAADLVDFRFLWNTTGAGANVNVVNGSGNTEMALHLISR